ncbi:MAG: exodeoxyribonuclease VII large subunit [Bdellovibrionaceae bacterium]|nr:exodeoxyribonuclease VII large subunit [Pseudobdellovibrionaceae bacterium]
MPTEKSTNKAINKWATLLEPSPEMVLKKKAQEQKAEQKRLDDAHSQQEFMAAMEASTGANNEAAAKPNIFSVSDINGILKNQIEEQFASVWVRGEISNFKAHTSGHHYFSLKDDKSQINAVMFKGFNSRLKFIPESGMEVIVRGRITVYEPRGTYQIFCETMEPVGAGALQKAFEQLKEKLRAEGLFASEHKQKLPALPKNIGIVTSQTGAALQDILNVLSRRYKAAQITLIPARVQGEGAAREVVRGIEMANKLNLFDVLIVGRGGGSIEDLWCFNEEIVARAIFASRIPIISAVGHEIDFTIADFVADVRAPTPSAAAEIVAQSASELAERISNLKSRLKKSIQLVIERRAVAVIGLQKRLVDPKRRLEDLVLRCDELAQRLALAWNRFKKEKEMHVKVLQGRLQNPKNIIVAKKMRRQTLEQNLQRLMRLRIERLQRKTSQAVAMLDSLSPLKVLARGYSITFTEGAAIKSIQQIKTGQEITTRVQDGQVVSVVKELKKN